jgi:hypothetical protein
MFLSHLPENPKAKDRYAKIQAQLDGYASAGTQVQLCFPDDYPGAKLSLHLGARNEVPGIYHTLQRRRLFERSFGRSRTVTTSWFKAIHLIPA